MAKQFHLIATFLFLAALFVTYDVSAERIVVVSDMHYDPYYGHSKMYYNGPYADCSDSLKAESAPYGRSGCDSPKALIESTFDQLNKAKESYTLIYAGDWFRHHMKDVIRSDSGTAIDIFSYLVGMMAKLADGGRVAPLPAMINAVPGNNDYIPDYYFDIHPDSQSQVLLKNMTKVLTDSKLLNEEEAKSYSQCAYYVRDFNDGHIKNLRLIALNTLLYTYKISPMLDPLTMPDPCAQFEFLEKELNKTASLGKKALILSHIPPALDMYSITRNRTDKASFFQPKYHIKYTSILKKYGKSVALQIYGHTHQLSFLADTEAFGEESGPGVIFPSISPIYGNAPIFFEIDWDDEKMQFGRMEAQNFDHAKNVWGYVPANSEEKLSFTTAFGPLSNMKALAKKIEKIASNNDTFKVYDIYHAGGIDRNLWPSPCKDNIEKCRKKIACVLLHTSPKDYSACLLAKPSAAGATVVTAVAVFVAMLLMLV